MNLGKNKILITGGATGIGFAFAELFSTSGSSVIICGRRKDALRAAQKKIPNLTIRQTDMTKKKEREKLIEWLNKAHPDLNVLVNNAGIQERMNISDVDFWNRARREIEINLNAPIHLSQLVLPILAKNKESTIINISSGLAFVPLTKAPIYCATKAAFHSFTLSLRYLVKDRGIKVIEVLPPSVNTDLGGKGLHNDGVPVNEFIQAVRQQLEAGKIEISYGFAEKASQASRQELDMIFNRMNP